MKKIPMLEKFAVQSLVEHDGELIFSKEKFAELIVDECCAKLLDMDGKTKGNHNYYKHAALEIKKHFRGE
jgi:hypothetical protein